MICNQNTKNGEKVKLLAVVAALVMVVCALAVVLPSGVAAVEPETPTEAPFGTGEGYAYENGVYTISAPVSINLNGEGMNLGTEANPLDIRFEIQKGGSLTFTNSGEAKTVYINYTTAATSENDKSVFLGDKSDDDNVVDLTVNGNVTLDVTASLDTGKTVDEEASIHIFNHTDVVLENGAKVVLHQAEEVYGTSAYLGSIDARSGTAIVFDGANGLNSTKLMMTEASLEVSVSYKMAINPAAGSEITDSTITSKGTGNNGRLYIGADVSITDSKVDLGNANLMMINGYTLTATGTTITTGGEFQYYYNDDKTITAAPVINGATLSGNFTGNYSLEDVTLEDTEISGKAVVNLDNTQLSSGSTLTISGKGVTVTGDLNNNGTVAIETTSETGGSGTTVTGPKISDLTVYGGTVKADDAEFLPSVSDGTVAELGSDVTTPYVVKSIESSQGVYYTFGIRAITYTEGINYGGRTVAVTALSAVDRNNNDAPLKVTGYVAYETGNRIYSDPSHAEDNDGEYGNIYNAGNYFVYVGMSVTTDEYGAEPITFVTSYTILPQTLSGMTLSGPKDADGKVQPVANQAYTGEEVTLEYGTDVVMYDVEGNATTLRYGTPEQVEAGEADFYLDYENNTAVSVGNDLAVVYVVFSGNYTTDERVETTFQITQGLKEIAVSLGEDQSIYLGPHFQQWLLRSPIFESFRWDARKQPSRAGADF